MSTNIGIRFYVMSRMYNNIDAAMNAYSLCSAEDRRTISNFCISRMREALGLPLKYMWTSLEDEDARRRFVIYTLYSMIHQARETEKNVGEGLLGVELFTIENESQSNDTFGAGERCR